MGEAINHKTFDAREEALLQDHALPVVREDTLPETVISLGPPKMHQTRRDATNARELDTHETVAII